MIGAQKQVKQIILRKINMAIRESERIIINAFVKTQEKRSGTEWKIIKWPDHHPNANKEIDAIAIRNTTKIAIEHMSIDAIENQRTEEDHFLKIFGPLEKELRGRLPFLLRIVIPYRYKDVIVGKDWNKTRKRLKDWILSEVVTFPDTKKWFKPKELPFSVYVSKDSARNGNIILSRSVSEEDFSKHDVTIECLRRHFDKLFKYKNQHYETILLIESSDIALMNPDVAKSIITRAADQDVLNGIDEIWYADSSGNSEIYFSTITPYCKN